MEIAATVNYKIEGGKDIPQEDLGNQDIIEELFDLSNTDYHYFQNTFLNKGYYILSKKTKIYNINF